LDIGVLGYIGVLQHKEHSPEVWHIPPGTPVYRITLSVGQNSVDAYLPFPPRTHADFAKHCYVRSSWSGADIIFNYGLAGLSPNIPYFYVT
jgi:hypothetical protein